MGGHVRERHRSGRAAWLRAAVLGADDGLVSTAALMLGVAAASGDRAAILTAGFAGLAAGSLSMAVGEYVSVSSQRDTELADLARETHELETVPDAELDELTGIYRRRGLSAPLARQVAIELSHHDALRAHAREELGLDVDALANPMQASAVSAASFATGSLLPIVVMAMFAKAVRVPVTVCITLLALGSLGAFGAWLGGAPMRRASFRVLAGGALALAITALVGKLAGAVV